MDTMFRTVKFHIEQREVWGVGWGWGKAGNTAQLSPAGAGAWAELCKIDKTG